MVKKQKKNQRKISRTLLKVAVSGNVNKVGKDRLKRAFAHLTASLEKGPNPPCEGGVLLVRWAGWRCESGVWVFVEVDTWRCPDGSIVDVEDIIEVTDDPCGVQHDLA